MNRTIKTGLAMLALLALPVRAQMVDRILATVGDRVITWSELLEEERYQAFLSNKPPPSRDPADAARAGQVRPLLERIIDQALLERERNLSPFSFEDSGEARRRLEEIQNGYPGPQAYRDALARYGMTEEELLGRLAREVSALRFTDYSLRPRVQIAPERIESYYRQILLPQWSAREADRPAPPLSDVRDEIQEILVQQEINSLLDGWFQEMRRRAAIRVLPWP